MKDQELEKLMRQIASDAALDDAAGDDIADSPSLWWSVQREIRKAEPAKAPWPPNFLRRLMVIAVPVAAALLIGLGLYFNSLRTSSRDTAAIQVPPSQQAPSANDQPTGSLGPETARDPVPAPIMSKPTTRARSTAIRAVHAVHSSPAPKTLTAASTNKATTEIKSDFIALAYARSPESGQLVRVKVPSSMMVQLGVVPTVSDPSKLIDAEVLVGDDGLTHAIRFIRQ